MIIRDATTDDIAAISALYNASIPTTTAAWTEALQTIEERTGWMHRQATEHFPVLVAVDAGPADAGARRAGAADQHLGFTAYGHFRGSGKWPGYNMTVEHSIHVAESSWGRGIGRQLLTALIGRAQDAGFHVMVAAIDGDNERSIAFHRRLGFVEVARMPQVGHKFGRWLDLALMQLMLDERRAPPNSLTRTS